MAIDCKRVIFTDGGQGKGECVDLAPTLRAVVQCRGYRL